jgi:hypothetical protein
MTPYGELGLVFKTILFGITTITLKRLEKKGYESMLDYY